MNDYTNTYEYYDLVLGSNYSFVDIPFYLHFIKSGMKVLDIGCGSGRVALELVSNRKECHVDAIDISPKMLKVFRAKLSRAYIKKGSKINIYKMDMRNISLKGTYDFIIFPFQSFQILTGKLDQINVLKKVKTLLNKNGQIILTLFDPTARLVTTKPISYLSEIINFNKDSTIIKIIMDAFIDFKNRIFNFKEKLLVFNENRILIDENVDSFRIAYHDTINIQNVIRLSGLSIDKQYSNYNFQRLENDIVSFDKIFMLY